MKTLFIKQALSLGMFAIAATGAFVSHTEKTDRAALPVQQAFVPGNAQATECNLPKNCQTEQSDWLCRVDDTNPSSAQMYGKVGVRCITTLYRITP